MSIVGKIDSYLKDKNVINEEANPMLVGNSLGKIKSSLKNIEEWTKDIKGDAKDKILSNLYSINKNVKLIEDEISK